MARAEEARRRVGGQRVRHPQVGTDDVDDDLPLNRVVLGQPFQCIQPGKADRRLVRSELVGGLDVHLGDTPLARVVLVGLLRAFRQPLPAHRQDERQGSGGPGADRQARADRLYAKLGPLHVGSHWQGCMVQ
jgi:hypothetical protein